MGVSVGSLMSIGEIHRAGVSVSGEGSMTSDDRLFAMVQRVSAIESQLITRRSFLGGTDVVGARSYRELQELRRELDEELGYGTRPTVSTSP